MRYFLVLLVAATALQLLLPVWWAFVPLTALLAYLLARTPREAFLAGLAANLLIWGVWTALINVQNEGILAYRVAGVLGLGSGWSLVGLSAVLAGILGAFAGWAGVLLRSVMRPTAG